MCSSPIGGGGMPSDFDFSMFLEGPDDPSETTAAQATAGLQAPKDTLEDDVGLRASNEAASAQPYEAAAGKPDLSPTIKLPKSDAPPTSVTSTEDQKAAQFSKELEKLPPGLRQELLKDMAKPEGERDPELVALEGSMNMTAGTTVFAQQVQALPESQGQPSVEGSPEASAGPTKGPGENGKEQPAGEVKGDINALLSKETLSPEDIATINKMVASGEIPAKDMAVINQKLQQAGQAPINVQVGQLGDLSQLLGPAPGLPIGKIDPTTMTPDEMVMQMKANGLQVAKNQARVLDAQAKAEPEGAAKGSLMEYLQYITKVITDIQKMLGELTSMDAQRAQKAVLGQKAVMEAKMDTAMKALEKAKTMRAIGKLIETVAKVIGPIIAVVCLVLAIISGGTLAILLAVVMLVIALAASLTTIIDDMMKKVMEMVMGMFKSMGLSEDQALIATMLLMIIACIVMMVVAQGAAASSISAAAGQAATQATNQATQQVTKQLASVVPKMIAGQVGMLVIGHNNVIQKGMKPLLKAMGFDEKTADMIAMLCQMLAMLAVGIYSAGGLAGVVGIADSAGAAGMKSVQTIVETLQKAMTAIEGIASAITAVGKLNLAKLKLEKASLDADLKELDALLKGMGVDREARDKSIKAITDESTQFGQLFTNIISSREKILSNTFI